jgi:hypothetical protein
MNRILTKITVFGVGLLLMKGHDSNTMTVAIVIVLEYWFRKK